MKGTALVVWVLLCCLALWACPPPSEGCQSNAECPEGQVCNARGSCVEPTVVPPRDAGPRDLTREDRLVTEDAAVEDATAEDASPDASDSGDLPDGGVFDAAGVPQVNAFTTCSGPRALALTSGEERIYVACEGDDTVHLYSSIVGRINDLPLADLASLPSPCKPKSLHLHPDVGGGQLWVSCSDFSNQKVYNVDPDTGAEREEGINYGGGDAFVRFASAADRIAFVGVGDSYMYIRSLSGNSSETIGSQSVLLGGDVGMTDDGNFAFFTNSLADDGRITRTDGNAGPYTDYFAPMARTSLIEVAADNDMIIVSNATLYARLNSAGASLEGAQVVVGTPLAISIRRDGSVAYLASFNAADGSTTVYEISTDPSDSTPTLSTQVLEGCTAVDIAAALDGRVFAACVSSNLVRVLTF